MRQGRRGSDTVSTLKQQAHRGIARVPGRSCDQEQPIILSTHAKNLLKLNPPNDVFAPGLIVGTPAGFAFGDCASAETETADLGGSNGHGRSAKKAAAIMVGLFGLFDRIHC